MGKAKKKITEQNNAQCIRLNSVLELSDIAAFYQSIKASVGNDNNEICFDASEIIQMSTAHVQVFISLFRWFDTQGVEYKILNPSKEFLQVFIDLGISNEEMEKLLNSRVTHE